MIQSIAIDTALFSGGWALRGWLRFRRRHRHSWEVVDKTFGESKYTMYVEYKCILCGAGKVVGV